MKLFLSYSHKDKAFVDQLYSQLVKERVAVWMDRIELNVGDSLLDRVQTAISKSGYLAVVLSKSFVRSAWCKKELNAGLMRELDERRVIVLPILTDKCTIPVFLRDKRYADFRANFNDGLDSLLRVVAAETSQRIGRLESPKYHTDFAYDYGTVNGIFSAHLHAVSMAEGEKYSVLSNIHIVGGEAFSKRFNAATRNQLADIVAAEALAPCAHILDRNSNHLLLNDDHWTVIKGSVARKNEHSAIELTIRCRRLGEATGHSLMFHYGSILGGALQILNQRRRPPSKKEFEVLSQLPGWELRKDSTVQAPSDEAARKNISEKTKSKAKPRHQK